MATDQRLDEGRGPATAEPPEAGRTTQESMRQAAHQPVKGPVGDARLAAIGGLEVPAGSEEHESIHESAAGALIPGAREVDTLTHREPGAVGGQFNGGDIPAAHTELLDEAARIESYREGGLDRKSATRKARVDDERQH